MIRIISEKSVKIRKRRQCFACLRMYDPGSEMNVQTNSSDDWDIAHIYTCPACHRLITRFPEFFIDDGMYSSGCVREFIADGYSEKTPEQLLEHFRNTIGDKLEYKTTNA